MTILEELAVATSLPLSELTSIIDTAPRRYKVYFIRKRNGGWRQIAHPARELKIIQRCTLEKYLSKYPVHAAAAAYVKGRGIIDNALVHASNPWFLKLDFQNFFPSITVGDWRKFREKSPHKIFSNLDRDIDSSILFWGEGTPQPRVLSIGAPTSPMVSNIILFDLDASISELAIKHNVNYSRYADDITISGLSSADVLNFEKVLRREVGRLKFPTLTFNDTKRGIFGRGDRRLVTGLVVTPQGTVSLGRERKRMMSALLHKFALNQLDPEKQGILKGMLGLAIATEPALLDRMRLKYGNNLVDSALRIHIPPRIIRK